MRKVRDHSRRYDQALTDLFGVDGSFLLEDAVLQQVPAQQGIAQAWSLGATIADADPDRGAPMTRREEDWAEELARRRCRGLAGR